MLLLLCTLKPWLFVRTVEEPKLCPETCAWRAAAGACSPAVTLRGLPSRQGAPSASRHLSLHKRTRDESEKIRGTVAWGHAPLSPALATAPQQPRLWQSREKLEEKVSPAQSRDTQSRDMHTAPAVVSLHCLESRTLFTPGAQIQMCRVRGWP